MSKKLDLVLYISSLLIFLIGLFLYFNYFIKGSIVFSQSTSDCSPKIQNYCAVANSWYDSGGWGKACGEVGVRPSNINIATWTIYKYTEYRTSDYRICKPPTFTTTPYKICSFKDKYNLHGRKKQFLRLGVNVCYTTTPTKEQMAVYPLYKVCCQGGRAVDAIQYDDDGKPPPEGKCPSGATEVIFNIDSGFVVDDSHLVPDVFCQSTSYSGSFSPVRPNVPRRNENVRFNGMTITLDKFGVYEKITTTLKVGGSVRPGSPQHFRWFTIKRGTSSFVYLPSFVDVITKDEPLSCFYPRAGEYELSNCVGHLSSTGGRGQQCVTASIDIYRYVCYRGQCYECLNEPQGTNFSSCQPTNREKCLYHLKTDCLGGIRE